MLLHKRLFNHKKQNDMKENNVFNQLRLIKAQRNLRQKQIDSVAEAVCSFIPHGKHKEAKVFEHLAMYLAFIAQYLEDAWQNKIAETELRLNKLHELVGEAPVDACLAQSLGVLQGANITGFVVSELLSRAQSALNHSTALTVGQHSRMGLPLFANDGGEDLVVACLDAQETAIPELARRVKRCLTLATKYEVDSVSVVEFMTPSISSYVNAVTMNSSAVAFLQTAKLLNQPFAEKGVFDKDLAPNSQEKEIQIARALAAGIAADIIISNIHNEELWNIQFLN